MSLKQVTEYIKEDSLFFELEFTESIMKASWC